MAKPSIPAKKHPWRRENFDTKAHRAARGEQTEVHLPAPIHKDMIGRPGKVGRIR